MGGLATHSVSWRASKGVYTLGGLLQHAEFFADLDEGGDALVEVLALVAGGELDADAGFALWYDGIVEAGDVDAFFLHLGGEDLRELCVV